MHQEEEHYQETHTTNKQEVHDLDPILSFTSSNEYDPVTWAPWRHLAEPFRETTLTATSTVGDPSSDSFTWRFPEEDLVLEGREVTHTFDMVGKKTTVLTQTVAATGRNYHLHGYIMVKYVRREIRQLKTVDREAFLDAMETLYRLSTKEGVRMYGDAYKGIDYFVQLHLDGAGIKDCDHWHDDAGIMTHHIGYTLEFEQALQVVDPSVAIPYWEYTIESAEGFSSYGDSVIFDDDWLGEASPSNSLHTVDKGRWAYLSIMKDAWDYVHNPYGLLRTPWNLDSTPYVTRFNLTSGNVATDMVSCSLYHQCFEESTLSMMNNCLNGGTHGPVHILVGGEWDDPEQDFISKVGFYESTPLVTKYLWRKGYLRFPDKCEVEGEIGNTDTTTCRTSCPAAIYESRGMTPYDVLMDVNALYWESAFTRGTVRYNSETNKFYVYGHEDDEEFQTKFWSKMLHAFCDPGHLGEMYTSSAPYDPLFWIIHPAAERFFGWRRYLARHESQSWPLDETWGYSHGSVIGETGVICNWDDVREGTMDMPTCVRGICGGHKEGDLLPFKIRLHGETVMLTNAEWLNFLYPENESLPYMFNEYRWDHCVAQGFDFGTKK